MKAKIEIVLNNIKYKNWDFRLLEKGDGFLLQVVFKARCVLTDKFEEQKSRKWYISSYACESEIVRTALKAVESAELHEVHENFIYKGHKVFDPHQDPTALVNLMESGALYNNVRK